MESLSATAQQTIEPPNGSNGDHSDTSDTRDRIAQRAYELYLARGGAPGGEFDDWIAAERELSGSNAPSGSSRDE